MVKKSPLEYSSSYLDGLWLHYFLLCFKWNLVFHFSTGNLQNLTILLFTATSCIHFILSYTERCQMLSGNEYRLYLNSCSSSCSPRILLLMSLIDPCNVYFQGDILFTLLVVSSDLPELWICFWLFYLWFFTRLLSTWVVGRSWLPCCLLIWVANKLLLRLASWYLLQFHN
jgi:hypothetical protein